MDPIWLLKGPHEAPGWTALTPLSHSFGPASSGQSYSFTFVNFQIESSQHWLYLPLLLR